ncbi:MAG TPA: STY0301 family protein [Burkholderiales bacterium]|nr:STY0301 family protein [Burkholderiales bacterium]
MRPTALAGFALAAVLATAARAEVLCPDSLEVRQEASAPADWTVSYTEPPLRLTGVTIYDGPPSQNRRVKPHSVKSTKGELQVSWRLPQSRRNFHLVCSYERTSASLVGLLPPGVNGCNAVFDRRVSYGNEALAVKRMVCN